MARTTTHPRLEQRQIRTWDGTEVCVYDTGPPPTAGTPLVFANGLGGPIAALTPQIERFSPVRRVLTWDYRGLYRSNFEGAGRDMSIRAHARDLLCLIDALEVDRIAIFGWSMGVQVAFELAALAPRRVHGLVLLNGLAGKPLRKLLGPTLNGLLPTTLEALKRASAAAQSGLGFAARFPLTGPLLRASGLLGERFPAQELTKLLPHFADINVARYLELLGGLAEHDAEATLESLNTPTLVLGSSSDRITPAGDGRKLARSIRDAEYREISWASHYAALEAPDEVYEFAEEFLVRRVDRAM